jgi:hypothetical protein
VSGLMRQASNLGTVNAVSAVSTEVRGRMRSVLKALPFILAIATTGVALAQTVQQPFSLTISAAHDTVKAGAPIVIEIRFKNVSDHNILRTERPEGATHGELLGFPPIVRDEEGKGPPLTKLGRLEFRRKKPGEDDSDAYMIESAGGSWLRPGGIMTPVVKLNELYDLSIPGKYAVQVLHGGYDLHGGHDDKTEVKSNTITVTVVP